MAISILSYCKEIYQLVLTLLLLMNQVFGSAGVIGNPMGFARRVGHGVKDFLSVPAKGVLQVKKEPRLTRFSFDKNTIFLFLANIPVF